MQAKYLPWAIAGGACATLAPGTALWLAPLVGALAHMAYDTDPETFHDGASRLLSVVKRAELPERAGAILPARREQMQAHKDVAAAVADRDPLLATLENEPHRLIIGRSRGGKTTLIHEMATSWASQGERVMVIDPDAAPGQWPGCRVVGGGDDLEAAKQVLDLTAAEVTRRRQLRKQGQREFAPMHLVIDEAHDVLPVLDHGLEVFEDITRRGGKLNMHLTVGVQDKQMSTLGLEGKTELLKNFIVADVLKGHDGKRQAVIRDAVTGAKTAYTIPQLTDPETLIQAKPAPKPATKATRIVAQATETPDNLLASMLHEAVPAASPSSTGSKASEQPGTSAGSGSDIIAGTGTTTIEDDGRVITIQNTINVTEPRRRTRAGKRVDIDAMRKRREQYQEIKQLVADKVPANDIVKRIKSNRKNVLGQVRRAKAELGL